MKRIALARSLTMPLALLTASCSTSKPAEEATTAEPVALVKTALATLGSSSDTLQLYGVAEAGPGGERALATPTEATLVAILAPSGTSVGAGTAVVSLRPTPRVLGDQRKAASDQAVARAAYARALRLRADGLNSNAEVEVARGALNSAHAALQAASGGGSTLRAPVAGTVQALTAKPGDVIPAGTTLATIAAAGERRARFGIDPSVAPRIRAGEVLQISSATGGTAFSGTVVGVDPAIDATTKLASVFARVPQGVGIGQALRASVVVGATTLGITVPYTALLDDGGKSYVYVISGGKAHRRDVSPGSSNGDRVAILRGVAANEHVVTEGGTALEDGMKVRENAILQTTGPTPK